MRPGFLDLLPLSGEISSDRPYSWLECQSSGECVSLERDDQQVSRLAYNFELTGIRRFLSRDSLRNRFRPLPADFGTMQTGQEFQGTCQ